MKSNEFLLIVTVLLAAIHPMALIVTCPRPYTMLNGFCLFWNLTDVSKNWCESARFCHSIGGELALGIARARAARYLSTTLFFLGATDFLVERYRNRTGWLMTNGTEFPELGDDDWTPNFPDDINSSDDCLAVRSDGIMDATSGNPKKYLCQPIETPYSGVFKRSDFLQLGDITPNYCYTDIAVEDEFACLNACASRWECRAALVNVDARLCRMLDYSDSSVGDEIEKDPAWRRFVKMF